MSTWTPDQLQRIVDADDLHISPYRPDGTTPGTPTWIWCVAVDGQLYVRGYNGTASRWYQAAKTQRAGRIRTAGTEHRVTFELIDASLNNAIDDAYRAKYATSPYLPPMIGNRARAATIRINPHSSLSLGL